MSNEKMRAEFERECNWSSINKAQKDAIEKLCWGWWQKAWQAARAQPAADPWEPSGIDYDRSIHSNPDAAAWAKLFVETFPGQKKCEGLMLGWFANAMMAMHDHLQHTKPAQPANPEIPEGALKFTGVLHDIGRKWIDYAKTDFDTNDISVAVWSAMREALTAQPAGEVVAVKWWNGCDKTVPAALRYLADHERPREGEQRFNSLHLLQLAEEIEDMAKQPLYTAPPAQVPSDSNETLRRISEILLIGEMARTSSAIIANVENAFRRSQCLSAIESKFFTSSVKDEDGELQEDCILPWGATPDEYAKDFGEAMAELYGKQPAQVPDALLVDQLADALRDVEEEMRLLSWQKSIELRRPANSFGIAVKNDPLALEWQEVDAKLQALYAKRRSALSAAPQQKEN